MILRTYQQRVIDALYHWWIAHPGAEEVPLIVVPTGGGKAVIAAELTRLMFEYWPESHPRTIVIVPSKELAEQNADKLARLLPAHLSIGYYSASLGQKAPDADVIVATIGSIYRDAHRLGNIKMVVIDEAHLVNPGAADAGRYRKFLADLARYCTFRAVGMTATPFRGNGIWLTEGDAPLFTGIASTVQMRELLDAGYLSPLTRPIDALGDQIKTRIDTAGISTASGDYKLDDLAERVDGYLPAAAQEAVTLAQDRRKWIAFCATVANAEHFVHLLDGHGITAAVVCGETPKADRERLIADFRASRARCLVTVLALAIGFDVPDVDCLIWLRPTISPVLYCQGAGRGMRIADGKKDCLWLDFSDTTERLGPVDAIKGRCKRTGAKQEAPHAVCPECGTRVVPASLFECPDCGAILREEKPEVEPRRASNAPVLSSSVSSQIFTHPVSGVRYLRHTKFGSPDSLRVDYYSGLRRVASEWICVEHVHFARARAAAWWRQHHASPLPNTVAEALGVSSELRVPASVIVNESGRFPEIVGFLWSENESRTNERTNQLLPAGA